MRWGCVAVAVVAAGLAGCLPRRGDDAGGPRSWVDRYNPFAGPGGANKVVLDTALLDRPAGDAYLSAGLWASAGRPLPLDKAAALAENGVRVGLVAGVIPTEFSRAFDQDAVSPWRQTASPGDTKVVPVNGPVPRLLFSVRHEVGADPVPCELTQAECGVAVTAAPADGGKVKLAFEPRVQHGDRQGWFRPSADGTGFLRLDQKPLEAFPKLGWEVTVGPKEFVVIGAGDDPADKLGGAFFFPAEADRVRQRVLVVRAYRLSDAPADAKPGLTPPPKPGGGR